MNRRRDRYGGPVENRCRLLFELAAALVREVGAGRVGVRLSPKVNDPQTGRPGQCFFGAACSDPAATYGHAVAGLNDLPLAYLLLTEPRVGGLSSRPEDEAAYRHPLSNARYRALYRGTLMGAGGFTPGSAARAVAGGAYDLIAFGRWFHLQPRPARAFGSRPPADRLPPRHVLRRRRRRLYRLSAPRPAKPLSRNAAVPHRRVSAAGKIMLRKLPAYTV